MNTKKTPKADLENKRVLFIQLGIIFTLAIVLLAFEWKTYDRILTDLGTRDVVEIPEEMIEITRQDQPPPPVAPPPQTTQFKIVEDDVDIKDDFIIDVDVDQKTEIEAYVPPVSVGEEEEVAEQEIFIVVEDAPQYPGGDEARIRFLNDNIRYPQMARESGIQGIVYITFVVERDGSITDVRILRPIGGGCDEEAIRVIKAMPKWTPGKQRGRPVRVQFNMPIRFTLQ
ncbi:MAG TPA: energy transducer TonB [Bacteroidales bacterium]|nr:energy transducer TonB [Bacteroidales bacterium]